MGSVHVAERLTRSGPSEITDARHHLEDLVRTARALTAVAGHHVPDPPGWACPAAACPLAHRTHGRELCAAAHRLAATDPGAPVPFVTFGAPSVDDLVARFEATLVGAVDAVRACRQTAHPGGSCWFRPHGAAPSPHGHCGEVLHLVHRICGERPRAYDS